MHIFMHGIILAPATSTELNGETALFKVQRWHFATITLLLICTPEYYYRTKNNNYRGEEGVPFAHNQESLIFTV